MKKAYPKYNDTSVEWLGQAPEHWEVFPLWSVTQLKSIKNHPEEVLLSVYLNLGVIRFSDVDEKRTNATSLDLSNYQLVEPGDFVLNNQQAWRGSVGVSQYKGIISPAYLVLALSQRVDPGFGNYFFRNGATVGQYLICSKGVGTIQRNLYWNELKRVKICLPPLPEQRQIAAFLDHKCALIDTFIQKKTRLIELLKEQKQAIINKAVTKGIDPNVRLKPSGIEWLGEIPEGWEVKKLKYSFSIRNGQVDPKLPKFKDEILLAPNHIESGTGKILYKETVFQQGAESGKYKVLKGEVVYSKIRPELRKACIAEENCLCSADMYPIRTTQFVLPEFFLQMILGESFSRYMSELSMRVAMPKVNREDLNNYVFALPTITEQKKIVSFIEREANAINKAITRIEREITLLQEYKTTLIAEAVTGKIDVRDWRKPNK